MERVSTTGTKNDPLFEFNLNKVCMFFFVFLTFSVIFFVFSFLIVNFFCCFSLMLGMKFCNPWVVNDGLLLP